MATLKNIPLYLFLFCLFFAPLAFGTVELWSLAGLEVVTALAFTSFFCIAWVNGEKSVQIVGLLPLALLLIFILLQLIPLPQSLIKVISPGTLDIYGPVINSFEHEKWIPISVDRKATLHEFMRLASYGLMYILTIQLLSRPDRLKRTVNFVVFLGAFVAVLALIQNFTSFDKIYWLRAVPANASPFGPWVNPNQFAGYIELISPLALALFLFYRPRVKADESWRERFISFFSMPGIHFHLFLGFAALVTGLSVFVSLCRGGMLSLLVAGFVFLFLYNLKFPKKGRATLLLFVLCLWGAVSWFGWDLIVSTFNHSFDESGRLTDGRLTLWADVVEIVKKYPIVGVGFGSFLSIYPLYKTIDDQLIYDHAHNDYLELLTDGGVLGFLLVAWFIFIVIKHGWKMIRVRNDHYSILLGIGSISGICALLAHSMADFNLHNGAVGFYFFFVCGLLVSSVNSRFGYYSQGTLLKKKPLSTTVFFSVLGIVIFCSTLLLQFGTFWAGFQYRGVKNTYINIHLPPEKLQSMANSMNRAIKADPFEGFYHYKLGSIRWYQGDKEAAFQHHAIAGYYNPLEGIFLQQLGLLIDKEDQSKSLIEHGLERALNKEPLALSYAEWLFWKARREEALEVVAQRWLEDYRAIEQWMPLLNAYDVTTIEHEMILPKSPSAWLHFGRYCELNRSEQEADYFFSGAMAYLSSTDVEVDPQWFRSVIRYFQRQKQQDMALLYTRQAVNRVPEYPEFHIILGDYYRRDGITYRAKEEYEQALVLEPENQQARKRLRQMGFEDAY